MKPIRLMIAGVAGLAGLAALMLSGRSPPPVPTVQKSAPVAIRTNEILAAKSDVKIGSTIKDKYMHWIKWPEELISGSMITRVARPNAIEELRGAIVRHALFENEPIREDKLIKGGNAGFLSTILPEGKRAVAISIDSRGATSAGGFILPNDRVDVLSTSQDSGAPSRGGRSTYSTTTLLTNIRVLAIGQNIQEKNGEKVVVGETATLELDPAQAELVTLSQRMGSLALALRSLADAEKPEAKRETPLTSSALKIVRSGVVQETPDQ